MSKCKYVKYTVVIGLILCGFSAIAKAGTMNAQANRVTEVTVKSSKTYDYKAPDLPSPQDWVLVLERIKK